ncbi:MAG: PEPxxWA-CTERM sorting domain-containing protein [Methyloversatilis sp.]|nr:PEPxxWA-CTERM sorting domain-containing protein [Methyloversatilis sp.]
MKMHSAATDSFRRLTAAPLCALALAAVPQTAFANFFDLRTGVDFTTWTLSGDATAFNNDLGDATDSYARLNRGIGGGSVGGAFAPGPVIVDFNAPFEVSFRFFVSHSGGVDGEGNPVGVQGDGLTFFMTGNTPALGQGGSDLGYGGSGMNGYAFAVDTFNFDNEPQAVSVQILGEGSSTPLAFTETGLPDIQPADYYQWFGTVGFTPSGDDDETGTLSFEILQAFTNQSYRVEWSSADWSSVATDVYDEESNFLGRGIHFGFTAGNGLADDVHFVGSLTVAPPIPEPSTWAMLLAGLGLAGFAARARRN